MELVERLPQNLNLTVVNRAHAKKAYADGVDVYVAITQDSFLRFNIERDTKFKSTSSYRARQQKCIEFKLM